MNREGAEKITIKFKKGDYEQLKLKVKETNTTMSDYIRPIILREIYNRNQSGNIMEQVCKVTTLCNQVIQDCEMSDKKKRVFVKEAKKLWEELK